jgi:hypothetical protein
MSLTDITPHLVTDENPATSTSEGMDWERCAALHNHIVLLGPQGSGREITPDDQRSWWEFHGLKAEALSAHLSPSLIQFLKHAQMGPSNSNEHSFFYYVNGLKNPDALWMNQGAAIGGIGGSVITLYNANDLATHPDGLKFVSLRSFCNFNS